MFKEIVMWLVIPEQKKFPNWRRNTWRENRVYFTTLSLMRGDRANLVSLGRRIAYCWLFENFSKNSVLLSYDMDVPKIIYYLLLINTVFLSRNNVNLGGLTIVEFFAWGIAILFVSHIDSMKISSTGVQIFFWL